MSIESEELEDFDTSSLISELEYRLEQSTTTASQKIDIESALRDAFVSIFKTTIKVEINNLNDIQKMEHISKIWNKYTPQQIETALPE